MTFSSSFLLRSNVHATIAFKQYTVCFSDLEIDHCVRVLSHHAPDWFPLPHQHVFLIFLLHET